jgi:hypothetical protein
MADRRDLGVGGAADGVDEGARGRGRSTVDHLPWRSWVSRSPTFHGEHIGCVVGQRGGMGARPLIAPRRRFATPADSSSVGRWIALRSGSRWRIEEGGGWGGPVDGR